MTSNRSTRIVLFRAILLSLLAVGQSAVAESGDAPTKSWSAPPFWMPSTAEAHGRHALTSGPAALPFIALPPCRLVDTRGNGAPLTGGFLPPATVRNYTLAGVCGVPANAQAISLNATAVKPTGPGFLVLYPEGGTFPPVSTLNYLGGDVIVNAAVVPLSATGGIAVALGVNGGDVLLDTNGYYAIADVASLSGLVGDVTLAAGANVTITPSLNTLTIAATGGPGGSLPAGTQFQTLYNTGGGWAASSVLLNNGTGLATNGPLAINGNLAVTGSLDFPNSVSITTGGVTWASIAGANNTFLGRTAGAANVVGKFDTFLGDGAGASNTTADGIVAVGRSAHSAAATAGGQDVAVGHQAMRDGNTGNSNVAVGTQAYVLGPAGSGNVAVGTGALMSASSGDLNVAVGSSSLVALTSGSSNTVLGANILKSLVTGNNNIAIGADAGGTLTTGSGNLYVANAGAASESNTTRIGSTQTRVFISGVAGVTTGVSAGGPVFISTTGQLGTTLSSARYKHDIRDMGELSARLMQLRPVTFRYDAHGPEAPLQFGLVAEEVNEVLPELVARNKDGEIETVMYHELPAMLLNEIQRLERRIAELERRLSETEGRRDR